MDLLGTFTNPTLIVTLLGAVCAFATVLTLTMPILARDRMSQRMRVMAIERDKMRAARIAELARERQAAKLRHSQTVTQQIVERWNLRKLFENEDLRDKLKRAGLRGQAPIATYMFFRVATPLIVFAAAIFYLLVLGALSYPPMVKLLIALAAAFVGSYLPTIFIHNLTQKRQNAIQMVFPVALDMLLICVQSGMSVEAAFGRVA
jgi:tight adherence protein C